MNKDRRATAQVCVQLIKECSDFGEMSDESHEALVEALKSMRVEEYWSLNRMSKHAGKNESTDKNLAIGEISLPALVAAEEAIAQEDYAAVITQLELAITTDGTAPVKAKKRKRA